MLKVDFQGVQQFSISGDATIYDAGRLVAALAGLDLAADGDIRVDLASLEALDVAGVQILVAFRRHLGAARVSFHNIPAHILQTLRLGGMECHLR
jgi:ABC-type transporter Mla MlaB component